MSIQAVSDYRALLCAQVAVFGRPSYSARGAMGDGTLRSIPGGDHDTRAGRAISQENARRSRERRKVPPRYRAAVARMRAELTAQETATGVPHVLDHRRPLACGGTWHPRNLQILTAKENSWKRDSIGDEWRTRMECFDSFITWAQENYPGERELLSRFSMPMLLGAMFELAENEPGIFYLEAMACLAMLHEYLYGR